MHKKVNILATTMAALLVSTSAQAIQFDGFLTSGVAWSDSEAGGNRYIGSLGDRGIQEDASFETDTRFGLQISSDIADNMSVTAQILGTGVDGNFDAVIEWAYVEYDVTDWLSIRTGKLKQPVYLVNDYVEVGYAYPWIRPPVEVYYLNNPLNTINGIEALIQFSVGPGTLSFQPYFGSNRDDIPNTGGQAFFEAERIRGIDVKYSGRGYTVHASKFECGDVITTGNVNDIPTAFGFTLDADLNGSGPCDVTSAGFNLDVANIVVYSEWQDRGTKETLARPFGDQNAFYTTLGYRFGKWLPHITFASIDGEAALVTNVGPGVGSTAPGAGAVSCGTGNLATSPTSAACSFDGVNPAAGEGDALFNFPVAVQTSITYGLRYEINDSAALKIEHSIIDVENDPAELASTNNPALPGIGTVNFGLFDTTFEGAAPSEKVGITSIAIDVIF